MKNQKKNGKKNGNSIVIFSVFSSKMSFKVLSNFSHIVLLGLFRWVSKIRLRTTSILRQENFFVSFSFTSMANNFLFFGVVVVRFLVRITKIGAKKYLLWETEKKKSIMLNRNGKHLHWTRLSLLKEFLIRFIFSFQLIFVDFSTVFISFSFFFRCSRFGAKPYTLTQALNLFIPILDFFSLFSCSKIKRIFPRISQHERQKKGKKNYMNTRNNFAFFFLMSYIDNGSTQKSTVDERFFSSSSSLISATQRYIYGGEYARQSTIYAKCAENEKRRQ